MATSLSCEKEGTNYIFQILEKPGPRGAYEARQVNGGFYVRVDMPGVSPEGVKLFKRGKAYTVTFTGKAPRVWTDFEDSDRVYGGYVVLDRNPDEVEVDMSVVNGSLRLFFPASEGNLHFFPPKNPQQSAASDMSSISYANPFLLDGTEIKIQEAVDRTGVHMFVRIDMPGLAETKNNVKFVNGVTLSYKEEGSKDHPLDEGGRTYAFHLMHQCTSCKIICLKHEMKYGVLRVSITRRITSMSLENCQIALVPM